MTYQHKYRVFEDPGHAWLEVPRAEVEVSGASITPYSYYNPATGMAYLEEDCDMWSFLQAVGKNGTSIGVTVNSSLPRRVQSYVHNQEIEHGRAIVG